MQRMKLQIWWRKKIKTKKRIRGEEFLINIQISYRQTVYHIIYISYAHMHCSIWNYKEYGM